VNAGWIPFVPGDLDAVVARSTSVATMGEDRLRRCQHHGCNQPRPEQFSPHWRKGTGVSGNFLRSSNDMDNDEKPPSLRTHSCVPAAATTVVLIGGGIASAHVDPDPVRDAGR